MQGDRASPPPDIDVADLADAKDPNEPGLWQQFRRAISEPVFESGI